MVTPLKFPFSPPGGAEHQINMSGLVSSCLCLSVSDFDDSQKSGPRDCQRKQVSSPNIWRLVVELEGVCFNQFGKRVRWRRVCASLEDLLSLSKA